MKPLGARPPARNTGASNKDGPPVFRPPTGWAHIRGKPRTREPVADHLPDSNHPPSHSRTSTAGYRTGEEWLKGRRRGRQKAVV
ncbi:hypothetical protein [uncultured Sunxiuqinia sp.]|uniref:hypothetical protein n=1 Tax=uncultured Sunxiuqinia sp. TaxID=1573825 RepID=UPI00261F992E|nr:hypothetical protein [uncultured Sunxiuqinia sp.]